MGQHRPEASNQNQTDKRLLEDSFSHSVQRFGNLTSYNELTLGQCFCSFSLYVINFCVIFIISCHLLLWGLDSCGFPRIFKCIVQLFICSLSGLSMLSQFSVRAALAVSLRLVSCAFLFIFLFFFHPLKVLSSMLLTFLFESLIEFVCLLLSSSESLIIFTRKNKFKLSSSILSFSIFEISSETL